MTVTIVRLIRKIRGIGSSERVARSSTLSRLQLLIDAGFRRETRAVAVGRRRYWDSLGPDDPTQYRLRRNIHRIEKGLIHKDRRDLFALDYLRETIDAFAQVLNANRGEILPASELAWARDVLIEYFASTRSDQERDQAKSHFLALLESASAASEGPGPRLVPYHRAVDREPMVPYEQFLDLAVQRRSVRWFRQEPVPRDLIDQALVAAAQSPSACNRQPFKFRIFDEPEAVRRVARIPGGTAGYSDNFPAVAVIVGDLSAFFSPRDRHVIYIDGALAAMTFMLALETLGLSSCPINWPDVTEAERQMRSELALSEHERVVMLIAFGYPDPDGLIARSQKRPVEQLRSYPPDGT